MPSIIDDRTQISTLDKSNVLSSVEKLPDQITHAYEIGLSLPTKTFTTPIKNIVFSGMGGSALGGRLIKSLYSDELTMPIEVVNHYKLPNYVNSESLVILSSYSGTTEETLASANEALGKNAQVAVITAGGELQNFAQVHQLPLFLIDPKNNPSNQPRMAIGYSVFGQLSLLKSLGILKLEQADITELVSYLQEKNQDYAVENTSETNLAKALAYSAVDRLIYLVSADHLVGAAHVFNNQINENSKQLTSELVIPEMDHHYLEALSFPTTLNTQTVFWFFNSELYLKRIQDRVVLTQMIVNKASYESDTILMTGKNKLIQAFELIQLGAYTNFYLSMLNNIDPAPIPNVSSFKEELDHV